MIANSSFFESKLIRRILVGTIFPSGKRSSTISPAVKDTSVILRKIDPKVEVAMVL